MKRAVLCLCTVAILASAAQAVEFIGVNVPDTLTAGDDKLVLNGVGTKQKFFMDLYVGGLYLLKKSSDAQQIVDADEPMAIMIHITSSLWTEKKMAHETEEGFVSTTGGDMKALQGKIDKFIQVFSEQIKKGDVFQLVYLPNRGVTVWKNGSETITLKGLEFKKALFGIWIGRRTVVNRSLSKGMLGLLK